MSVKTEIQHSASSVCCIQDSLLKERNIKKHNKRISKDIWGKFIRDKDNDTDIQHG